MQEDTLRFREGCIIGATGGTSGNLLESVPLI